MKPTKKAIDMTVQELAAYIDHSVLKPEFTQEEIRQNIEGGINYGCRTVCINPSALDIAVAMTKDTYTKVCVVCDFPFGAQLLSQKCFRQKATAKKGFSSLISLQTMDGLRAVFGLKLRLILKQ